MPKNVGETDRTLRLVAGIILLSLTLLVTSEWRWLGLIGLIPFVSGAMGVCPLYTIVGINTCEKEK
jgi:hypothetical protein